MVQNWFGICQLMMFNVRFPLFVPFPVVNVDSVKFNPQRYFLKASYIVTKLQSHTEINAGSECGETGLYHS